MSAVKAGIIGRFAPSPTGPLHLGSLVTAVGSCLFARSAGGNWLLRMDDLDAPRVVPGMADDILRTLETLGLEWDGEVLYQSRRSPAYEAALERLRSLGTVYECGCSRSEIVRVASAPHHTGEEIVYPGTCRKGLPPGKAARALRLRVEDEPVSFQDGVMGTYSQNLREQCGDFVIKRADGPFAYHLAVVVDDEESGVNQVVRGADLIASTPRQIYLQRLLGFSSPSYVHLPLVLGPDGGKLSKRDNAVSLAAGGQLTRTGPNLLLAALRFLGQDPPLDLASGSCREILAWGAAHLEVARIPREFAPMTLADRAVS